MLSVFSSRLCFISSLANDFVGLMKLGEFFVFDLEGLLVFVFVVEAPDAEGDFADGHEVEDFIEAEDVGNGSNGEYDGDGEGVIEHELEGEDTAFDPVGGLFLDSGLGGNVDKVEGETGDKHEQGDGDEEERICIPTIWL